MTYTETHLLDTIEQLTAAEPGALSQQQLDGIDQFHAGGSESVDRLLPSLCLRPGLSVLDVGSGFGGPARQVARLTGASVVGVDITPSYVETAAALTRAAGLSDRIDFHCADVSALEQHDFDAAYTMHVQMNVADKYGFFTAIASRLRRGARLAVFEVCRTGEQDPELPLPWSIDGSDSFLATADELRDSVEGAGFETIDWVDETRWIRTWFDDLGRRMADAGPAVTLPALLEDGPTRMLNFAVAVGSGVLSVHRGSFTRV